MTVMYFPDIEFGCQYVACIEGKLREVYLQAIVLDMKCNSETPQYLLSAAGLGDIRVDIEWQVRSSFGGELCTYDSILADSREDWLNRKFYKYNMLSTDDGASHDILRRLLPNFSFGPDIFAWKWNKETLRPYQCDINWKQWRHDALGFFTDIPEDYYYSTEEECFLAHEKETELVTF